MTVMGGGMPLTPLNVFSRSTENIGRLMSNFARTPFVLDGVEYASIEGFYVALKFLDPIKRAKVSRLYGSVVKQMGKKSRIERTCYGGEWFAFGSDAHVELIKRAIRAKLRAYPDIARAFAATDPRPIIHDTSHPEPPDTEFPAAAFCRILAELREEARQGVQVKEHHLKTARP
jgi:predicted NAD-dependent protein-ADP-ribosyltransferase YbiA (DUF1768 family)